MNRTKRLFAILMAAVFALSLVPAGAFAASGSGEMYDGSANTSGLGSITIENTMTSEQYDLYRIFDLASFNDSETNSGSHTDEAYTYVISETLSDGTTVNPWWTFITSTYLETGKNYVYLAQPRTSQSSTVGAGQLFWYDPAKITLKDPAGNVRTDYHVIEAAVASSGSATIFDNDWDVAKDSSAANTYQYDEQDYANPRPGKESVKTVQKFAQLALAYARQPIDAGDGSTTQKIAPNYYENGNGNIDAPGSVLVNGTGTLTKGTDHDKPASGKVYLGWYLMGTSVGALASLDTTNKDVTIYEKSENPDIKKRVLNKRTGLDDAGHRSTAKLDFTIDELENTDADSTMWVKNTDADIGDYVLFKTVISTQQGMGGYVLHDVLEDGLEFVDGKVDSATGQYIDESMKDNVGSFDYSLRVFHVDYEKDESTEEPARRGCYEIKRTTGASGNAVVNYYVKTKDSDPKVNSDGCDFEIEFNDVKIEGNLEYTYQAESDVQRNISGKDKIVVLYWARVKENAALWGSEKTATGDASTIKENSGNNMLNSTHQVTHTQANGNGRNDNYTILTYGSGAHTKIDNASVTAYQFDVVKTQASDTGSFSLLKGAKFSVYKANNATGDGGDKDSAMTGTDARQYNESATKTYNATEGPLAFVATTDTTGAYYRFAGDANAGSSASGMTTLLESKETQEISLRGLEAGTYLIYEEEAPVGFNKLAYPIVVTIKGDADSTGSNSGGVEGTLAYVAKKNSETEAAVPISDSTGTTDWNATSKMAQGQSIATYSPSDPEGNGGIHIINQAGQELPSTGGMGTTIFYVVGGVLVAGAVILLVTKRRMGTEA